jgi:hypothetical protein
VAVVKSRIIRHPSDHPCPGEFADGADAFDHVDYHVDPGLLRVTADVPLVFEGTVALAFRITTHRTGRTVFFVLIKPSLSHTPLMITEPPTIPTPLPIIRAHPATTLIHTAVLPLPPAIAEHIRRHRRGRWKVAGGDAVIVAGNGMDACAFGVLEFHPERVSLECSTHGHHHHNFSTEYFGAGSLPR